MENQSIDNPKVELNPVIDAKDLFGLFRVSDTVPDGKPIRFIDQVVVYTNSTTYRLYWYDVNAGVWHYVTATA